MKKIIVKNFIIYSVPDILAKAMPFLTLPIATAYLTLEDFGKIALFQLMLVPFIVLSEFGQGYIINSMWHRLEKNNQGALLGSIILTGLCMTFFSICCISFFREYIFELLIGKDWFHLKKLYWVLIVQIIINVPITTFNCWVIIEQRAKLSSMVQTINILLMASLYLSAVIITSSFYWAVIAQVTASAIVCIIMVVTMLPIIKIQPKREHFTLILKIGSPILLRAFFNQLRNQFDKFFVVHLFGSASFALYNLSGRTYQFIKNVGNNYEKSYSPIMYKQLSADALDGKNLGRVMFGWFYFLFSTVTIIYMVGEPGLSWLTHGKFNSAYSLILLFICIPIGTAIFIGSPEVVVFHRKTVFLLIQTIIDGCITIALCFLLIPRMGAHGAIIALWAGQMVYSSMSFFMKQKLCPIRFIESKVFIYAMVFYIFVTLKVFMNITPHPIISIIPLIILSIDFIWNERAALISKLHRLYLRQA